MLDALGVLGAHMCDEHTLRDAEVAESRNDTGQITRRQLGVAAAGATLAAMLPKARGAESLAKVDVRVTTPDGEADCYFAHPSTGKHPGVIVWPDILGLRPAFRDMGDRLASSGYAVLTVNPYYRRAQAPVVAEGASFRDPATRQKVMPLARSLTPETNVTDANAFVAFLDAQGAVDTSRPIGTTGYCMGGPMTMRTAAAVPGRIGAGASFHGGGLVTGNADSPHLLVPTMRASFLFAIADNDDQRDPDAKGALREAFDSAGLHAEIEVYEGAQHGWCPPDSAVYSQEHAERAWERLLVLFGEALA